MKVKKWNGTDWEKEINFRTVLGNRMPRNIKLVSNPKADDMVVVLATQGGSDQCTMYRGRTPGPHFDLKNMDNMYATNTDIAYEQSRGRALVVYVNRDEDVYFRTAEGYTWSKEDNLSPPKAVKTKPKHLRIAADPTSNRIVLVASTNERRIWVAVWDGEDWGDVELISEYDMPIFSFYGIAVAFEGNSGKAIVTYKGSGNKVMYRTWSGSWSREQDGPDLGRAPMSMTLESSPDSNKIMLSVQDADSGVSFCLWDSSEWKTVRRMTSDTGDSGRYQPYHFLWRNFIEPAQPPTPPPTLRPTVSSTPYPTKLPTPLPTRPPTSRPTALPTKSPTLPPTPSPTLHPTVSSTPEPTKLPTPLPTPPPTSRPTTLPTKSPTLPPPPPPTVSPTVSSTPYPTKPPTPLPTPPPTSRPTALPTKIPTLPPTADPTSGAKSLTLSPSIPPTPSPTTASNPKPTQPPTQSPTLFPTTPPSDSTSPSVGRASDSTSEPAKSPTLTPSGSSTPDDGNVPPTPEDQQGILKGTGRVCANGRECISGTCRNSVCMASNECFPVHHKYGTPFDENAINIVFVPSGFDIATNAEWRAQVVKIHRYFSKFNMFSRDIHRVNFFVVSPKRLRKNKSYCNLNCGMIERLLCCDLPTAHTQSGKCFPAGSNLQTLVIHNDSNYGGGGYTKENVATLTTHPYGPIIAVHELGHSLFELGDEYSYATTGGIVPNCDATPTCNRWSDLIGKENELPGYEPVDCVPGCANSAYFVSGETYMNELGSQVGAANDRFICCTYLALTKSTPAFCNVFDFSPGYLFNYCKKDYQGYGPSNYDAEPSEKIPVKELSDKNVKYIRVTSPMSVKLKLKTTGKVRVQGDPIPLQPGMFHKSQVQGDFQNVKEARKQGYPPVVKVKVFYQTGVETLFFSTKTKIEVPAAFVLDNEASLHDSVPRSISKESNQLELVLDTKGRGPIRRIKAVLVSTT